MAHTPNIDALAKRGLLYRNSYSNAPVCAPSRFAILTGMPPESCSPANQHRARARFPASFKTYPELLREAGYYCTNNDKTDYNSDIDPKRIWDVNGRAGHWRGRAPGQPFMAVFNSLTTHESKLFTPMPGRVKPKQVRVPAYLPDTPIIRGDIASYYNLIERMDSEVGQRLAELEADGLAEDTIVFYYSDNGGVLPRSKHYSFDEGYRCATVIYVPPNWHHLMPQAPGSVIDEPITQLDYAPTLLALAGLSKPAQMTGRSLLGKRARPRHLAFGMRNRMDERIDFSRSVTDGRWRYIRNYMPHREWGIHGAFQGMMASYQEWEQLHLAGKLNPVQDRFFQKKPFEELYDLSTDPDQIDNLAQSQGNVLRRFSRAMDRHMLDINDNGFIPEGSAEEGYFESRDRNCYPLEELIALGALAARGDPANLQALRRHLQSGNAIVRYWAATGLLILGTSASAALVDLRCAMIEDSSPYVRAVAAEAAALNGDEGAITVLSALAAPAQPFQLRLRALAALTALGERARPALPTIRQAAEDEYNIDVHSAGRYLYAVLNGTYVPTYPVFDMRAMADMVAKGRVTF